MAACAHCGGFIHDGPELCDNCAKPENLVAYEADHERPAPDAEPEEAAGESLTCEVCGFTAKSAIGLRSHLRTHSK